MKRTLLIAPLLLLLMNCGSFNSTTKRKGKTFKTTVLDHAVEKSYLLITETYADGKSNTINKDKENTETEIRNFLFTYDEYGQLINTYSSNIINEKASNPSSLGVTLNTKKQLTTISLDEDTDKLKAIYKDNILHQITHYEPEFKELVVSTFTYDKHQLPVHARLGNESKPNEVINLDFTYDLNQNVRTYKNPLELFSFSYDDKQYILAGQPYYYNPFYYMSIDWLTFTSYAPKNNIVGFEDDEHITTIDYTYNTDNLPITARVRKTSKTNALDSRVTCEYEFYYKELEVIRLKNKKR
ncbi:MULTISPECIES: hypothetical protein [Myroides]|uniref:hypothetical protein n=1 Tax=Myroides TaxID=76831 RepID=UPI000353F194|nr:MULTISPECIES: hypothetical protein [Myroides]AJA67844.1 hypothetical protein MYRA21_0652 [Myroides sp. A21]EPH08350.1 hypothetical protein HMPREF9713_03306 [Myroides odoratimimus CCUG 12700]MDM1498356.1 hypothetical protein [Myroides odoratimimus]MDM1511505.1 hypothetical protein [Myroides odoratimimus]MDM1518547.1 hypothetical protein [Myroides odoratimimus]